MSEIQDLLALVNKIQKDNRDLSQSIKQLAVDQAMQLPEAVNAAINESRAALIELKNLAAAEANHARLLQDLIRNSAVINSSLELDQVLENLMDTITNLTGAERSYLLMLDETDGQFKPRIARNWDKESLPEADVSYSLSVIDRAVKEGKPIITDNAQTDTRFDTSASVALMNLRSVICIPLHLYGKVVGVLYADNRLKPGVFRESLVPLLAAFATQAGIAIQNARQFEKIKDDLAVANRQVLQLRILLNQNKISEQVESITESEYFQNLQAAVDEIRAEFEEDL